VVRQDFIGKGLFLVNGKTDVSNIL